MLVVRHLFGQTEWLKHIVLTRQPDGSEKMSYLPVTITEWQPQERKY